MRKFLTEMGIFQEFPSYLQDAGFAGGSVTDYRSLKIRHSFLKTTGKHY